MKFKRQSIFASVLIFALLMAPLVSAVDLTQFGFAQDKTMVRAYFKDVNLAQQVVRAMGALTSEYDKGYLIIPVNPDEYAFLEEKGFKLEYMSDEEIHSFFAPQMKAMVGAYDAQAAGIPGYSCYRTVEETFSTAQNIVSQYPNLATWSDVGNSWEKSVGSGGYDMMVLKLTSNAVNTTKPKLFITSAIHAREYTTAELVTRFAEKLVQGYGNDPDATWILDYNEIHMMLQANPDGRKKAEAGSSWRKNTNTNYCGATSSSRGADLNRNFNFKWGCCNGSSGYECDITYRGASAASEPEVKAIQNYIKANFTDNRGPGDYDKAPDTTTGMYLDIHSHGQLLLHSWGHTSSNAPNHTQLQTLTRKLAYYNGYKPGKANGLYAVDGSTIAFGYGVMGLPSMIYELGTSFFQQCSTFENTIVPDNMPSLMYAAKVLHRPYVTPAGPEAYSLSVSSGGTSPGVPAGTQITLKGTVNDARYGNSNGSEPSQNISSAEYYVDKPWFESGATPYTMSANDGSFNSSSEVVKATVDTTGWSQGRHTVFIRGKDTNGKWGSMGAIFIYISGSSSGPNANFTFTKNNLTVSFNDTSTCSGCNINSWNWDFGDGKSSTQQNPSHTFANKTKYTVKLTVSTGSKSDNISKVVDLGGTQDNELQNGKGVSVSGNKGEWKHYFINVPSGASNLVMKTAGGTGDIDLYTKFGSQPTSSSWDCRPYKTGNAETCTVPSPQTGKYYVSAYMYNASSNATLTASYDSSGPTKYTLTTNVSGQGSITLDPPGGQYDAGTQVKLTANASSGNTFTGWSGDLTGSTNPATITMNANKSVTANFKSDTNNQKSCEGRCGQSSVDGTCWCDNSCASYGDCCADKVQFCGN